MPCAPIRLAVFLAAALSLAVWGVFAPSRAVAAAPIAPDAAPDTAAPETAQPKPAPSKPAGSKSTQPKSAGAQEKPAPPKPRPRDSAVPRATVPNNLPNTQPGLDAPPGTAASRATVSPLPPRPSLYPLAAPSVPQGQVGAAPNFGPVTGYGPGGMGHIPGAPPNPPYR